MAIKLLEAGFENFTILEKASQVGGTWWHNQYPGAACDVPSHLYSFSFETKRDWASPYARAPEIQAYMQGCAEKYGLMPFVRFDTSVVSARWCDSDGQWTLETSAHETLHAHVLIAAQGMFNELSWPGIPGLGDFHGTVFHSARWRHDHDLRDQRVGVIGSAASAVQFVPEIAPLARQLTLFQRTPNWVLPKNDEPYRPERLAYYVNAPDAVEQRRAKLWNDFEGFALLTDPERKRKSEELGLENIAQVDDLELRKKLTPDYEFGCKRVLLSSKYYPTFNRANVSVETHPIEQIVPSGVLTADDVLHEFDTLVVATGFDVTRYLSALEIVGRDGRELQQEWSHGARAYLGITTAGFPNLFQIYGPNTNKGSILFMIECQSAYIVRQIVRLHEEDLAWLDVRADVMETYDEGIQHDASKITVWAENCNNYYRNASGRVVTQYPRNMGQYRTDTLTPDTDAYSVRRRGTH
jgi:cation diffusion facilitator CzcD-associated flavoprotein CzcO